MILKDLRMERIMLSNKSGLRRKMTRKPLASFHGGRKVHGAARCLTLLSLSIE